MTTAALPDLLSEQRGSGERVPTELIFLGCATALFLNHSGGVSGINLSLADPLMVVTLIALAVTRKAIIPSGVALFFCVLIALTVVTALFVSPAQFGIAPNGTTIFADLAKLIVCLMYLAIGTGMAKLGAHMLVLRWFTAGAALVAFMGVAMQLSGVRLLGEAVYYGGTRYKGFMVDPNFWAILSCAAIPFLVRDTAWRASIRLPMIACIAAAILLSGSKTGMIALLIFLSIATIEYAVRSGRKGIATALIILSAAVALLWTPLSALAVETAERHVTAVPQLARIVTLLEDPLGAVSEGGSARADAWTDGVEIISASPLLGVGVGSYSSVADMLFGERTLAHNTYIQLAAEWGLPLAAVFFVWLAINLGRASAVGWASQRAPDALILRDMLFIFLIGSLSLSLNNARMFWFLLGMLIVVTAIRGLSPRQGPTRLLAPGPASRPARLVQVLGFPASPVAAPVLRSPSELPMLKANTAQPGD